MTETPPPHRALLGGDGCQPPVSTREGEEVNRGKEGDSKTPFPAWHRRFVDFKEQHQKEREGGSACFLEQVELHSFIHPSNQHHETPTVWWAVRLLGYRGKQDVVSALREQADS